MIKWKQRYRSFSREMKCKHDGVACESAWILHEKVSPWTTTFSICAENTYWNNFYIISTCLIVLNSNKYSHKASK